MPDARLARARQGYEDYIYTPPPVRSVYELRDKRETRPETRRPILRPTNLITPTVWVVRLPDGNVVNALSGYAVDEAEVLGSAQCRYLYGGQAVTWPQHCEILSAVNPLGLVRRGRQCDCGMIFTVEKATGDAVCACGVIRVPKARWCPEWWPVLNA